MEEKSLFSSPSVSIFNLVVRRVFFLIVVLVPLFFTFQLNTYNLPKIVLNQLFVIILLAFWFLKMAIEGCFSFKRSELSYPIFLYFIISIFSLVFAISVPGGVSFLWQIFSYMIIYFIVVNHIQGEEIETWSLILSLVGIIISGYGILQYFGIEPLLKGYYYVPYIPFSTLGHRNHVAQYLILLIPLSGAFLFFSPSWIRRVIFGISILLMVYHLILTKSRGGLLGFIVSLLFLLGIITYKGLKRSSFFGEKRWLYLPFIFFLPPLLFLLFSIFSTTITLRVKHLSPIGYYIHSIDGSKIPSDQPIHIEFDFMILEGSQEKPGYIDLYGEQMKPSPINLISEREGWNHIKRGNIYLPPIPYHEDLILRWVPGSEKSTLQLKNIIVQSKTGKNLIKTSLLNRVFVKLGVTEIDKVLSSQTRLYMYRNTINMIKDHFFLGVGVGNFKYVYPRYRDRREWSLSGLDTRVVEAHNEYLQILSEVGILGFLAFLWVLWRIGRMSLWIIQRGNFSRNFFIALALIMGILATLIQSLFDFNLQNPASGITFWMTIGFLEIVYQNAKRIKEPFVLQPLSFIIPSKRSRWIVGIGIFVCLVVGIFYSVRPILGDYFLKRGRLYIELKDWEKAFPNFEKAKGFSPYHFDIYFHLGETNNQLRNDEKAIEAYKQCIALFPYFIEARNNLGAIYIRLGRIDKAIGEFRRAIEINPFHPGLHNNLGYLYNERNLLERAIEEYHKALELDTKNPEVHKNLGLLYFYKLKDDQKARKYWEKYLVLNPDDPQNDSIRNKIKEINERVLFSHPNH